jgi:hypothetical protein
MNKEGFIAQNKRAVPHYPEEKLSKIYDRIMTN